MKRLLLIVLPLLLMVGCEDKKATEEEVNPLVGVWDMTSASILVQSNPSTTITITKDANNFETMILGEDGTYSYSGKINGEDDSGSGSWSSTANKLTIIEDGETTIIDFSISGSTLTTTVSEAETDTNWGTVITIIYDKTS
jgi:PBP1b-binding outer membrane lipoprotein LpoB